MSNKAVIDTDFDPKELVRQVLNPSFALPVTALQREALTIRQRLGPAALQVLNSLNDGADAVKAILAVRQQEIEQFEFKEAQLRKEAEIKEAQIRLEADAKETQIREEAETKKAQIRLEAEAKEAQIRKEARAAHGRKGGAKVHEQSEETRSAVIDAYAGALSEVRKPHGGQRFHGDHGIAVKAVAEKLGRSVPTVRRHLKGLGPRSNKASGQQ